MANKKFKYEGNRQGMCGIEKSFDSNSLDEAKLKRLEEKGWVEVKSKPKPKSKKVEEKDNG